MKGTKAVVGVFTFMDDAINAVHNAKSKNLDYRVYSPVPNHELEHATDDTRSPVRFITGIGAALGLVGGFALATLCSMDYPLRVSAKNIVAPPSFVPVGYECTILFGGVFTLLALLHFCRLPDILRKVGFDPRFTQDKFGVVIGCDKGDVSSVEKDLRDAGAEEVNVRDGL